VKIAFFVSSIGDTDLALGTIRSLEKRGHEVLLVSLTKTAQTRTASFESPAIIDKKSLSELLGLSPELPFDGPCTAEQLERVAEYIHHCGINRTYFGVPSVNSELPFQLAMQLEDIPVLMAYEFMFKPPESHPLWKYLPELKRKPNVHWALPLPGATADIDANADSLHVIGHLSIDNAHLPQPLGSKTPEEIKHSLQVAPGQSLAFISSTTQTVEVDAQFLRHVLAELPKHPNMQIRLGLHPGIQDLDSYITQIISVYQAYPDTHQFKIILPESLIGRFKSPELTINNPVFESLFLRVNINGSEAAFAADRVAQAVPGALLNQAALEGKPVYTHSGKPYLPEEYFSNNLSSFFNSPRELPRAKQNEKTATEQCAELLLTSGVR
jgi:hypothetical protein